MVGLHGSKANRRLQLLFELALTTGLRTEELVSAKMGRVAADREGDMRVLGETPGSSNPAVTAIYPSADEKRWRQEFNKVFG